jgi:hypothetical protein
MNHEDSALASATTKFHTYFLFEFQRTGDFFYLVLPLYTGSKPQNPSPLFSRVKSETKESKDPNPTENKHNNNHQHFISHGQNSDTRNNNNDVTVGQSFLPTCTLSFSFSLKQQLQQLTFSTIPSLLLYKGSANFHSPLGFPTRGKWGSKINSENHHSLSYHHQLHH